MSSPDDKSAPTDAELVAAVANATNYKAAAAALGMPYGELYRRARKLRVAPGAALPLRSPEPPTPQEPAGPSPASVAAARRAPPPGPIFGPLHEPAPESPPPVLSEWMVAPAGAKPNVLLVRVDQEGRVRAEVSDLESGWASYEIRDVTGERVGKIGLEGSVLRARAHADEWLIGRGWLPAPPVAASTTPREGQREGQAPDAMAKAARALLLASNAEQARLGRELALLVLGW